MQIYYAPMRLVTTMCVHHKPLFYMNPRGISQPVEIAHRLGSALHLDAHPVTATLAGYLPYLNRDQSGYWDHFGINPIPTHMSPVKGFYCTQNRVAFDQ